MERYGLLGEKLSHSLSPLVHSKLCSVPYDLFEKSPDGAEDFIRNGDFAGINVTIPYKVTACCLCDVLSPEAERIGAVNTVVRRGDTLYGYNTDYFGFIYSVRRSGADVAGKKCLVLGSGGASKAVTAALRDLGAGEIKVISRSGEDNYGNISRHRDARVIVNATPLGMYPNCGVSPVDLNTFPDVEFVYDLIFNPMKTKLLLDAERLGIPFDGGLRMLVAQAKKSSDLFLGVERDDGIIEEICLSVRRMALNVILVGMPGSGKTRVGKLVAEATGKRFVDSDEEIVRREGRPIPEIFEKEGEGYFRRVESEVIRDICRETGLVVATGGGCVTVEENRDPMLQNGMIVRLDRDVSKLAKRGRPLSLGGDLRVMLEKRAPLYDSFSDFTVKNETSPQNAAREIISLFERYAKK